jgi:hypothetical protein
MVVIAVLSPQQVQGGTHQPGQADKTVTGAW